MALLINLGIRDTCLSNSILSEAATALAQALQNGCPMNESPSTFPQTRQDLSNLKNTAVDAAKDIGSTASVHVNKVKSNLQDIAASAQLEGGEHIDQAKTALTDLGQAARDYVAARPLASIGVAVVVGFLFAKVTSSRSS